MKYIKIRLLLSFGAFLISCTANSAWQFTPFITAEGIYTDNIELENKGADDEFILAADPGFELVGQGKRYDVNVNYAMRNLFYLDESDRNKTDHELDAFATGEVFLDHLFIDVGSTISEQIIDPDQRTSNNRISDTGNSTDVITGIVSPYITETFGNSIEFLARYQYGFVDFNDRRVAQGNTGAGRQEDSDSNSYLVELQDQSDANKINWNLSYIKERIQFEDANVEDDIEIYGAELGYRISPFLTLLGDYGYEDYNFGADSSGQLEGRDMEQDIDGDFWKAGFRWVPNANNTFEFKYGDREFGSTREALWQRVGGKLEVEVRYNEELTDQTRDLLSSTRLGRPNDSFARSNGLGLTADAFDKEELDLVALYKVSRSTYTFTAFQEERNFITSDEGDEEIYGFGLAWGWQFTGKSIFTLGFNWDTRDEDSTATDQGGDDERYLYEARIDTQFTPRTIGFAAYEREDRSADNSNNDFEENLLRAGVTLTF